MSGTSWVTLATNDSYSLGALVLGNSLRRVGTVHHLTVLITPGVTQPMRDKLSKIFNTVKEVNVLDSQDQANLALLSRPELGITFTKLNCWRLTQFSKGVFLDADTLVLQNCDELFDREELSAAPDAGWPDCFNSGVFVFRPSEATYQALIQFALTHGSFDGGDQGLLNLFFADWATKDISRHLPFIYNMVSTATYSYLPAFKQFGSNVKIAHFIGAAKPWLQYFDSESQKVTPPPSSTHLQGLLQIWWDIFCSQVHPDLSQDMAGLAGALAQLTLGVPRSAEQTALEEHLRRQSWEQGNADYMGRDSFDNIWRKISETLAQVPEPKGQTTTETLAQVLEPKGQTTTETLAQVPEPKVEEHKPQDIEAKVAESPQITEVPLSQVTPPEFISELKLQCTEPKVESALTSNIESMPPVTPAVPFDKEPAVLTNVIDNTLEIQPEQKLSLNDVENTSESSANIVTETIPTFISEYPPVDQTTLSDSSVLTESQDITQSLKGTIPTNTEEVKESVTLVAETKVLNTSTPVESSQSEGISSTQQEKDNEATKPVVTSEIPESVSVPCLSQESPLKSDQQPPLEEVGKAKIVTDMPSVETQCIGITDTTIPSPIIAPPLQSTQKLQSEVKSDTDPKLDIKEPITSTEQIILSNTTELPPSATESPFLVNVVTDIKIPSQADPDVKRLEPDSIPTLPTVLSGSEQLTSPPPPAEVSPSILESAGIPMPIDQPFVKLSDITESLQSQTQIEMPDKKGAPADPDLVPEKPASSPVTTLSFQSTGPQDAVGSDSDATMKSAQSDSVPQTPDSPVTKPISTALVAVPKKRPAKLPEPPKPTIPLPAPDSASTPPISSQLPLDLPQPNDVQILSSDVISAESKSESVPLSPILPSAEILGGVETQPAPIQSESKLSTTEESNVSAQEKTEITSQAPEIVQDKKVSKETGKPQTPTEATKITLEKQSSKEENKGQKSEIDSKRQTKPSKVIKQSSKDTESTKPEVSQPVPSTEPAPVKPKPKGLKGPKGPKSPPSKDAPQTPPPTKDAPQTPPHTKDAPQTPPPTKDTPQTPTVTAATPPISPISTPLMSANSESLKVDQIQPETPPVTSATPEVSGLSSQASAAKDPSEAVSPPVPPKRKNAKSTVTQSTDGAKPAQPKVSKSVKPKK